MTDEKMMLEAATAEEDGDEKKAFLLYQILSKKGDAWAMSALARFYDQGKVVDFDLEESMAWDLKAIAAGCKTSLFNLAVTYRRHGDSRKAREWFERSLAAGDASAALELAKLYLVSDKENERVVKYLSVVIASRAGIDVSEDDMEEALSLMKEMRDQEVG